MNTASQDTYQSFPAAFLSVRFARHFVRDALHSVGWLRLRLNDVELAMSELATNAIEYGGGEPFGVFVERRIDRVDLSVTSSGSRTTPSVRALSTDELSGRGLRIVSSVADEFDVLQTLDQVVVRCAFVRSADT